MIVPPRITPPIVRPEFPEAIGPKKEAQGQPSVWPGMHALVLGVPGRRFVAKAARNTLPGGRVTVLSPNRLALERLRRGMASQGFAHLTFRAARFDRVPLPDRTVDRVFLPAELSRNPDLDGVIRELRRLLDSGGQLIVLQCALRGGWLPHSQLSRICRESGFEFVAYTGTRLRRALVFRKQDRRHQNQRG